MRKPIIVITISLGLFVLSTTQVHGQVISHQQLQVDSSIAQEDQSYSVPTQISIVPLFPPNSDFNERDTMWFRGLYYYLIANERRPGFTDIPFHYIVSRDGRIFKGNGGGEERKINVSGVGDDVVVIGYLAGKSDNAFDPRAEGELGGLILDIANRNAIPLDKVQVHTVTYDRDDEAQKVSLVKQELFGLWGTSMNGILKEISPFYAPVSKNYLVEVVSVDVTGDQVLPGDSVIGSITLKNIGEYGIYGGSGSELIATKSEGGSNFYSTDFWLSTSQFGFMEPSSVLLPGQEAKFDFRLGVPLYFGAQSESFTLGTVNGASVPNSTFSIALNVKKPDGVIVEVKDTETGWLRVRSAPSGAATELTRISTGERYFQVEDAGNGWVKLQLNDGTTGWVSSAYLNYL